MPLELGRLEGEETGPGDVEAMFDSVAWCVVLVPNRGEEVAVHQAVHLDVVVAPVTCFWLRRTMDDAREIELVAGRAVGEGPVFELQRVGHGAVSERADLLGCCEADVPGELPTICELQRPFHGVVSTVRLQFLVGQDASGGADSRDRRAGEEEGGHEVMAESAGTRIVCLFRPPLSTAHDPVAARHRVRRRTPQECTQIGAAFEGLVDWVCEAILLAEEELAGILSAELLEGM